MKSIVSISRGKPIGESNIGDTSEAVNRAYVANILICSNNR